MGSNQCQIFHPVTSTEFKKLREREGGVDFYVRKTEQSYLIILPKMFINKLIGMEIKFTLNVFCMLMNLLVPLKVTIIFHVPVSWYNSFVIPQVGYSSLFSLIYLYVLYNCIYFFLLERGVEFQ